MSFSLPSLRGVISRNEGGEPEFAGFENSRYLLKWLLLGLLIGTVAGLGAVVFTHAIELSTRFFLGDLVGYVPPAPVGEGDHAASSMSRPWALPLVTALGGLLSGLIVFRFAPEATGHGTDAAIDAIHHKGARIRARIPPVKLIASAITIGSGGSAGREGPAAQISAGFASVLSGWLSLSPADRRIAVAAGIGAGIGAIFQAPLGGAVMAAEILYIHDLEVEALLPALIASIVGYSIYGSIEGFEPIFGAMPEVGFEHAGTLVYYAAIGLICGLIGLLYSRSFYAIEHLFNRLNAPRYLKPAIGGLLVGMIGLAIEGAIHTGYGWVQIAMSPELLNQSLWIVLVLPFAKILATSLSIGSGGSGGIFGPGMVIGGMTGAAFWKLSEGNLPLVPDSPASFVIVGMIAMFGGIAHAPLAMMLMVAEMTGNLSLLAPAMIAVALSTALVGDNTIYTSQLPTRADSRSHRTRLSFPLLSSLTVREAARAHNPEWTDVAPELVFDQQMSLDVALDQLAESGQSAAAVNPAGTVSVRDIMTTYRRAMAAGLRGTAQMPNNAVLMDLTVVSGSPLSDKTLAANALPPGVLVVAITRNGESVAPLASTELRSGDHISLLVGANDAPGIREFLTRPERST
jgi:CIC family chloride channel protein